MCVTVAGRIVAESTGALRLEEKGYPPVYYLPRIWHSIPAGSMQSKWCPKCVQSICQAIKGSALFSHLTHAGVHEMSNQLLFTPYRMGDLDLPNCIVIASLRTSTAEA
jgi:uncharacterized protein (DUF427 family)